MNKAELRQIILQQLIDKHAIAVASTQRAIDAATDEETVPEHKYDTLALEASYLAHGQGMRVKECEEDIRRYQELVLRDCAGSAVEVSAYVILADEYDAIKHLFIGPSAGGLSCSWGEQSLLVITPSSPLGMALMGKRNGDEVELTVSGKSTYFDIVDVF